MSTKKRTGASGTTKECLAHFGRAHTLEERKKLADFTGASYESSVHYWVSGRYMPVGEYLIKARVYLHLMGYRVYEFERLRTPFRDACKMLALRLATLDELVSIFEFTSKSKRDQALRVLLGKQSVPASRLGHIVSYTKVFAEDLKTAEQKYQAHVTISADDPATTLVSSTRESATIMATKEKSRDSILSSLAYLVRAMLPLAEVVLSDDFSPEDRKRVREKSGGDGVFRLSNALNRLCGERARNQF